MSDEPLLNVYLRDHMAGSRGGIELARRTAERNRDNRFGSALAEICAEIEEDRRTLSRLMDRLGVQASPLKQAGGWLAERLARLKLNRRLTGYSPLSRLIEIETLVIGVTGKLELWRALETSRDSDSPLDGIDLKRLIDRAESQRRRLEQLHGEAAREALS